MTRREAITGASALALASVAGAQPVRPNGAVALAVRPTGIAGVVLAGEDGARLDPDLRWHIGSNTKAMTAALYARAAQDGRCRWGASVASVFADTRTDPAWRSVPVEALMAHTAGLDDAAVTPAWLTARRADPADARTQRRAFVQQLLAVPPGPAAGRYRYGNAHFVVLGAAIERALDLDWEEAMRRHLFAPLGMAGAGFGAPDRAGLWGRAETPGGPVPRDPEGIADNPAVLWPSGGVHLPAGDYARFLALFLRDGAPLLTPRTLARLLTPPARGLAYAGGWGLADGGATLAHDGSNTLWFATARLERGAGRGHAAITNRGGAAGQRVVHRLVDGLRGR